MPGPLAQKIRAKFPGVYDDMDDATLEKAVLAKHPEYADLAEPEPAKSARQQKIDALVERPYRGSKEQFQMIRDNPVQAGATAGAMLAGPMGIAAAGLGAAGGAGLGIIGRQLATGTPEPAGQTLGTMAKQGLAGAAGEGAGRGVVKAADAVVPKVLKGILRPGKRVQQEYGDVVDVMRTEKIPVGQSAEAGARKMASAREADAILADAQQAGASPVSPREIVQQFRPLRDEVKRRAANANPDAPAQMQEIVGRAKALKASGSKDLVENQALKRQAQSDANSAFRAQDKGAVIKDTTAKLDKAVAVGRQIGAEKRAPAVKAVNQRTKGLMGLEEALEDAEARSGAGIMNLNPLSWLGNMVPSGASRATFAADAAAQGVQGTQAKLIRQALLSLLAGEQ
jgi:hypothetical protein